MFALNEPNGGPVFQTNEAQLVPRSHHVLLFVLPPLSWPGCVYGLFNTNIFVNLQP